MRPAWRVPVWAWLRAIGGSGRLLALRFGGYYIGLKLSLSDSPKSLGPCPKLKPKTLKLLKLWIRDVRLEPRAERVQTSKNSSTQDTATVVPT